MGSTTHADCRLPILAASQSRYIFPRPVLTWSGVIVAWEQWKPIIVTVRRDTNQTTRGANPEGKACSTTRPLTIP